jgi:leader peptidase (prepilin peptidase) / N-methyltransferase
VISQGDLRLLLLLLTGLPVSLSDLRTLIIPDRYIAAGALFAAVVVIRFPELAVSTAAGGLAGLLVFRTVWSLSRGGMGYGDVKYAAFVGAIAGLEGIFCALLIASLSGLVAALLLALDGRGLRRRLPFAPFLTLGGAASLIAERTGLAGLLRFRVP